MKLTVSILVLSSLFSATAFAADSYQLDDLVEKVSEMTKKKYVYANSLKGEIKISHNGDLSTADYEKLLEEGLYLNGYTKIPSDKDRVRIVNARDIRYESTPQYTVYKGGDMTVPDTFDYVMATYIPKHRFSVHEVTRAMRPFMTRYGRIITDKVSKKIIIQDTGKNARRIINLIRTIDVKPSKSTVAQAQKDKAHRRKVELAQAKACGALKKEVRDLMKALNPAHEKH